LIKEAKKEIQRERKVFDSSVKIAMRQALEDLKQKIEKELFSKNLKDAIVETTKDPKLIANLINTIVKTIEKFGIDVDISAYVAKAVDVKAINSFLLSEVVDKLKEKEIILSDFDGGVKLKLHDMQITIDISDKALKELVANYIRSDFRELIYNV
jgi:V/A-type H+-transporting ATPase subunit E